MDFSVKRKCAFGVYVGNKIYRCLAPVYFGFFWRFVGATTALFPCSAKVDQTPRDFLVGRVDYGACGR